MKMEQGADTFRRRVSQGRNVVWTDAELERISEMAGQRCTKDMIERAFPNRTYMAVKLKLHEFRSADYDRGSRAPKGNGGRASTGVNPLHPDDPGLEDTWLVKHKNNMMDANKAFLNALQKSFA